MADNRNDEEQVQAPPSPDPLALIAQMQTTIAHLQDRLNDAESARNSPREPTPANSAFGGSDFQPTGTAAHRAFKPYGLNRDSPNPNYSDKAKARADDPGKFDGTDSGLFDTWVDGIADKFDEDDCTFRKEQSRMAYVMRHLTGDAARAVETRYRSSTRPFSCAAEIIQVLDSAYHDPNQAFAARDKLRSYFYEPGPNANIHKFISELNSLADKARIPEDERKATLWEHIPPYLDHHLLHLSKDPSVSYEDFTMHVANAAYSHQRGAEYRKNHSEKRQKNYIPRNQDQGSRVDNRTINQRQDPGEQHQNSDNRQRFQNTYIPPSRESAGRKLSDAEMEAHMKAGTCFSCGKRGHLARDCKEKAIRVISTDKKSDSEPTDDEESGKE